MTFARLAKILAAVLVGFALWRARPPASPANVVVLALPGAPMDLAVGGAAHDAAVSFGGPILVPPATSGAAFWRRLLSQDAEPVREPSDLFPIWSGPQAPVRALAVPARLFGEAPAASDAEAAFVGSSAGAVVEAADITSGRLPAPYDRATDAIASAAASLPREQWSDWIRIEPLASAAEAPAAIPSTSPGAAAAAAGPAAQFQFVRASDTTYFFSPAYVVAADSSVGTPFLRGVDRDLRPLLATHVISLSRRRLEGTRSWFAKPSELRPVVVFDTIGEDANAVFRPDSTPGATLDQVRDAIVAELGVLRRAAGPEGLIVVIGGPPTSRETGTPAWFRILAAAGGGGDSDTTTLDFDAARALLRYLAGISLDSADKARVPTAVASRFPVRATTRLAVTTEPGPPDQRWSADALESVPGAVSANR